MTANDTPTRNMQVHRFGDCVALYTGSGETAYISADDAEALADALNNAANDVRQHPPAASLAGTVLLPMPDARRQAFGPREQETPAAEPFAPGDRVRLKQDYEIYPHGVWKLGETGTLVEIDRKSDGSRSGTYWVKLDTHHPELTEWDNQLGITLDDPPYDPSAFLEKLHEKRAPLTPCWFVFDESPSFPGFSYGTTWNGWDNVAVTPETHKAVCDYFRAMGPEALDEDFEKLGVEAFGLISYADCYTTQLVDDPLPGLGNAARRALGEPEAPTQSGLIAAALAVEKFHGEGE